MATSSWNPPNSCPESLVSTCFKVECRAAARPQSAKLEAFRLCSSLHACAPSKMQSCCFSRGCFSQLLLFHCRPGWLSWHCTTLSPISPHALSPPACPVTSSTPNPPAVTPHCPSPLHHACIYPAPMGMPPTRHPMPAGPPRTPLPARLAQTPAGNCLQRQTRHSSSPHPRHTTVAPPPFSTPHREVLSSSFILCIFMISR